MRAGHRLLGLIVLNAVLTGLGWDLARGQGNANLGAVDLIVPINGHFGDAPTFGAGIIFAREKDRFYIVTANHVLRNGAEEASDLRIRLRTLPERALAAKLLPEFDRSSDLAVMSVGDLRTNVVDVCALALDRLAEPSVAQRGLDVYPVGNPDGTAWVVPVRPDAVAEVRGDDIIFQSVVIARGHSGGGLLDARRRLIGLIQGDEPPYGRALAMPKVLQTLKNWGLPVHLRIQSPDGEFPLFTAVVKGDVEDVKQVLGQVCTDVNARTQKYELTALAWAAREGKLDMVKLLFEARADVNVESIYPKLHPVEDAAKRGHTEIVRFLLSHGARDKDHALCGARGAETIQVLLASGANPNAGCDYYSPSPIFFADCNEEILRVLINAGANVNLRNVDGDTPLIFAVRRGLPACVKILLEGGADTAARNRKTESPFGLVHEQESAALLLKFGGKIETEDATKLLLLASAKGWPDIADLLVKRGALVNAAYGDSGNPLENTVRFNHIDVARVLLQSGADPDRAVASAYEAYDMVGDSKVRFTPLQLVLVSDRSSPGTRLDAAMRLEWVKLLVGAGAKVNVFPNWYEEYPNLFGVEPLLLALRHISPPDLEVAKVLIAHGANVNAKDRYGQSLLHRVADPAAVELLRKAGAHDEPRR
jgi:ankyrin repeat protein